MRFADLVGFSLLTLRRQRFRSAMLVLSLALGVASTTLLVSLGEAARDYVLSEFDYLGTDVLAVLPGRKTTTGGLPPLSGAAARDITIEDAEILERSVPGIQGVAGLVLGTAAVSHDSRDREGLVLGVSSGFFGLRRLTLSHGNFWGEIAMSHSAPVAIIGETVRDELFGRQPVLGQWLRIRNYRFRVVGVLEGSGDSFGAELDGAVFIPVASAQQLFNVSGLFRLIVRVDPSRDRSLMLDRIERRMAELHDGELDVTVVNPDAMMASFSDILRAMTLAVAGIAAISLLVAGVLVMNLTLISVQQRTAEIGLLKAIGTASHQVRLLFIAEAVVIAVAGVLCGLAIALAVLAVARQVFGELTWGLPWWALAAVTVVTIVTAVAFAWGPASRAARLEPVLALGRG